MKLSAEILAGVTQAVFVLLGVASLLHWRRRGGTAGAWLAATFGTLALIALSGRFLPERIETPAQLWAVKVLIVGLAAFPYMLFRFRATFGGVSRRVSLLAPVLPAALTLWVLMLPRFPVPGEPQTAGFLALTIVFLVMWMTLTAPVAVGLWRAGHRQPTVARRRMRLLGGGAAVLAAAVLVSGIFPSGEEPTVSTLVVQLLGLSSAPLFFLGFAPPAALRIVWRAPEEAALREAQIRLMTALTPKAVADALLPQATSMLGSEGAALFAGDGTPIAAHGLTADRIDEVWQQLDQIDTFRESVETRHGLLAMKLRNGMLAVEASAYTPFFGPAEMELLREVGLFADLALERADLFERERLSRLEVERANAELESFVYSASHDLRSPLITMLSYLDYLQAEMGDRAGAEAKHYMQRIAASGNYMHQLIVDLLELSRIGRMQTEFEDVDLGALLGEIADGARASHPGAIVTIDDMPAVRMNPVRARQLFTNLVENAISHGGREDVHVRVWCSGSEDRMTEVVVADDGRGIPPDYRERIFGVFERLSGSTDSGEGTGIGLAICRKIVEHAGGRIWVADSPVGAELRMTLPAALHARRPETARTM